VVDFAALGEWLDAMILRVFSSLNDSMILRNAFKKCVLANYPLSDILC